MEIALIHNSSLVLGPMGFNVRMINSELEELELSDKISTQDYQNLPIHFSDGLTHLLPLEKEYPEYDLKYHNIGNFTWKIIEENEIPIKVKLIYSIVNKTLDEVKLLRKSELSSIRKQKENQILTLTINDTIIETTTSREEKQLLVSKMLSSSSGCYNFKFKNTWLEITNQDLEYIISEIDKIIQSAFDWEYNKFQEIDNCNSIDEVYNVII